MLDAELLTILRMVSASAAATSYITGVGFGRACGPPDDEAAVRSLSSSHHGGRSSRICPRRTVCVWRPHWTAYCLVVFKI